MFDFFELIQFFYLKWEETAAILIVILIYPKKPFQTQKYSVH